ncbi:MAG: glycosyltransferase family 4 protein [Chloroflexi bacterium]|nr:MAG: glycosyltransferase family 4 protein [Chloroflexota bacterium]
MQHFVVISPDNVERSKQVLALEADKLSFIPNGVDLELFRPRNLAEQRKMSLLEKLLVKSPRGWDESGVVGSIQYARSHLETFLDGSDEFKPVLMFAGRFLRFKRLPLLIADVFVAPSENEPFGLVFLEAMASGAPVIASRSGGPLSFVVEDGDKANGWFCEEDDPVSLTRVIIESVSNQAERRRRGRNARATVVTNYAWSRVAERFEDVYQRMTRRLVPRASRLQVGPRSKASRLG